MQSCKFSDPENEVGLVLSRAGVPADLDPPRLDPRPNPLADMDPPGPYPLADLDPRGPYPLADMDSPPRIWTPLTKLSKNITIHNFLIEIIKI